MSFPWGSEVKNLPANARDVGSIRGSGKSPGWGNGNPFQYFCLKNPMDRGAWRATVHGVAKSQTQLSKLAHTRIHRSSRKGRCNQSLILLSNCSFYSYILVVWKKTSFKSLHEKKLLLWIWNSLGSRLHFIETFFKNQSLLEY